MAIRSPNIGGLLQSLGQLRQANALLAEREAREIARKRAEEGQTLRQVGTVAGAVIGGIYGGGAPGAIAGASIGGAAGGVLAGDVQAGEIVQAGAAYQQQQQIGRNRTANQALVNREQARLQPQIQAGQQAQQAQVETGGLDQSPEFKQDLAQTVQQGQAAEKRLGLLQSLGQSGAPPSQVAGLISLLDQPTTAEQAASAAAIREEKFEFTAEQNRLDRLARIRAAGIKRAEKGQSFNLDRAFDKSTKEIKSDPNVFDTVTGRFKVTPAELEQKQQEALSSRIGRQIESGNLSPQGAISATKAKFKIDSSLKAKNVVARLREEMNSSKPLSEKLQTIEETSESLKTKEISGRFTKGDKTALSKVISFYKGEVKNINREQAELEKSAQIAQKTGEPEEISVVETPAVQTPAERTIARKQKIREAQLEKIGRGIGGFSRKLRALFRTSNINAG
jgi:hypothetical protein